MGTKRALAKGWWMPVVLYRTLNRTAGKGWWIVALTCLIVTLRFGWTLHEYVSGVLNLPHGDAPAIDANDDRPFWFMREKVIDGVCAGVGMVLSIILVALTWKRYRRYSSMALVFAWIWCMPAVADASVVYSRSSHLMDARRAGSGWKTYDEYRNDPLREAAEWGTTLFALPLAFFFAKRYGWKQLHDTSDSTVVGSAS